MSDKIEPIDNVTRIAVAAARLRHGEHVTPCGEYIQTNNGYVLTGQKTWEQCMEFEDDIARLWYNDSDNSTRIVEIAWKTGKCINN